MKDFLNPRTLKISNVSHHGINTIKHLLALGNQQAENLRLSRHHAALTSGRSKPCMHFNWHLKGQIQRALSVFITTSNLYNSASGYTSGTFQHSSQNSEI